MSTESETEVNGRVRTLVELIRRAASALPADVVTALREGAAREHSEEGPAGHVMRTILENVELACDSGTPMCQDTGVNLFEVDLPPGADPREWRADIETAVRIATSRGHLRQNTIDSVTGGSVSDNVAAGAPQIHFDFQGRETARVRLMLKGGGCENVGAQYALPETRIEAGRDLEGVRRCVLDAVWQAQGRGCSPGILGVCIGGDRASGYAHAKAQLWRPVGDRSADPALAALEERLLAESNQLGIGPMGMGGETTLLDVKIGALSRLPASFFVTVSYICWATRRQGVELVPTPSGTALTWLKPEELAK